MKTTRKREKSCCMVVSLLRRPVFDMRHWYPAFPGEVFYVLTKIPSWCENSPYQMKCNEVRQRRKNERIKSLPFQSQIPPALTVFQWKSVLHYQSMTENLEWQPGMGVNDIRKSSKNFWNRFLTWLTYKKYQAVFSNIGSHLYWKWKL